MNALRIHRYIAPETGLHYITVSAPFFDDAKYFTGTKQDADNFIQSEVEFTDRCNSYLTPENHTKINLTLGN